MKSSHFSSDNLQFQFQHLIMLRYQSQPKSNYRTFTNTCLKLIFKGKESKKKKSQLGMKSNNHSNVDPVGLYTKHPVIITLSSLPALQLSFIEGWKKKTFIRFKFWIFYNFDSIAAMGCWVLPSLTCSSSTQISTLNCRFLFCLLFDLDDFLILW